MMSSKFTKDSFDIKEIDGWETVLAVRSKMQPSGRETILFTTLGRGEWSTERWGASEDACVIPD